MANYTLRSPRLPHLIRSKYCYPLTHLAKLPTSSTLRYYCDDMTFLALCMFLTLPNVTCFTLTQQFDFLTNHYHYWSSIVSGINECAQLVTFWPSCTCRYIHLPTHRFLPYIAKCSTNQFHIQSDVRHSWPSDTYSASKNWSSVLNILIVLAIPHEPERVRICVWACLNALDHSFLSVYYT